MTQDGTLDSGARAESGNEGTCCPLFSLPHGVLISSSLTQGGAEKAAQCGNWQGAPQHQKKVGTPDHSTPSSPRPTLGLPAVKPGLGPRAREKNRNSSATRKHTQGSCTHTCLHSAHTGIHMCCIGGNRSYAQFFFTLSSIY